MITVTIEEAQARLPEFIEQLAPGERLVITRNRQPVAQLAAIAPTQPMPQFGSCRGKLTVVREDDEHLKDFADYMP
jgi:antitoxin (DNA-binding transcriptional repressor) of toxin-antitoxin stability system